MELRIPESVQRVLSRFSEDGYEAYVVGGCVRDSLLGLKPCDWDVTTSALPEQTAALFSGYKVINTGIKHGTVTVVIGKNPVEITTFRLDGVYSDNRRPDSVVFTDDLKADLSRRDFTINAMAYSPMTGLVDRFGSLDDLRCRRIRTVGDPDARFIEDGLRVIRGLRFAAVLGFDIEKNTADGIRRNRELLKNVSVERLFIELTRLVTGNDAERILLEYGDVLGVFIPDILPAIGFRQYGKKYAYDVWEHICRTVGGVPADKVLCLTMLLHDLGKIPTAALDENGNSTFHDHAAVGAAMAEKTLLSLKSDKKTVSSVVKLIALHDFEIPVTRTDVRRLLQKVSPDEFRQLLLIKTADRGALSPAYRDVSKECALAENILSEVLDQNLCRSLGGLAVNGRDLERAGFTGTEIGRTLSALLDAVIEERCENNREALLSLAASLDETAK